MKSTAITDVARRAGVSIKTVSRVVTREPGVSDDTPQAFRLRLRTAEALPDDTLTDWQGGAKLRAAFAPGDADAVTVAHPALENP